LQPQRLLATDLDGTFIGDDDAMHDLWDDLAEAGIFVAFSTGRHLPSIEAFYAEKDASHRADACLCMVGTEIWHRNSDGYRRDHEWSAVISEAWDKPKIETILQSTPGTTIQDDEWQSPFKSSYFLTDDVDRRLAEIRERLDRDGLRAKIVYSAGRFLDLLPIRSGKGEAVQYLVNGLSISPREVVTAGDTGNDLDMMRPELGFRSVAVGNATEELRNYRVPNVYHARLRHATGIREGLVHYGWLDR